MESKKMHTEQQGLNKKNKIIVIVGGVAAGASTAARLRRLDEHAEIILLEKGKYVSFANCGLPYYLSGEISDRGKLLVQTPEKLKATLNIDVRVLNEVTAINPEEKIITVKNLIEDSDYTIAYDELVLATGATALTPPIPGIESDKHFSLRTIPDLDQIYAKIDQIKKVVVVGGGYIGIEAAEQLHERGLEVSIVQAAPHILAPFDSDMVTIIEAELISKGIKLYLNNSVTEFIDRGQYSELKLRDGSILNAELAILSIGVRPESSLAKNAGLEIGNLGGIRVNEYLQTSNPNIWAAGDSIEVKDLVTNDWTYLPLAGPANRQGRIIADNLVGIKSTYKGSIGTAILRVFKLATACTGANETKLKKAKIDYHAVYLHPNSHAGYYPGAKKIATKLLFEKTTGRILGAQCIGEDGVDKRIDVIATAIKGNMTVDDLADLELAYAPPYGSAKDPVNIAGMAAQNIKNGLIKTIYWHELDQLDYTKQVLLDVRDQAERNSGSIENSIHIPLAELRKRISELPKNKEVIAFCASGQRSALACRILTQNGFECKNLTGAYLTWKYAKLEG